MVKKPVLVEQAVLPKDTANSFQRGFSERHAVLDSRQHERSGSLHF